MGTFSIVMDKPCIEILLQSFHRFVKLLSESLAKKLIQDRAVEPFYKAVCFG
jgi:hypothetical protein